MSNAIEIVSAAGPWVYPVAAVALGLSASVVRAVLFIRSGSPVPPAGLPHHAVLGWGALGVLVGLTGTVIGVGRLAAGLRAVMDAGTTELEAIVEVVMPGLIVVAAPVTLGLWLMSVALVAWLALGFLLNRFRAG